MSSVPVLQIRADEAGVVVDVVVAPRASKCAIAGVHGGRLKVMLDASPVDGKANEALVAFLAKSFGRPKRDVTIVRGEKGRQKTLVLRGVSVGDVMSLVPAGRESLRFGAR
jgi:uncharacterized protein (TIGR00251 family)